MPQGGSLSWQREEQQEGSSKAQKEVALRSLGKRLGHWRCFLQEGEHQLSLRPLQCAPGKMPSGLLRVDLKLFN